MTPDSTLARGERALRLSGIHDPKREARILAEHVLGKAPARSFDPLSFSISEEEGFLSLVARRSEGEPLQYIIGCWDFFGREFLLSPSVLIPRPETELLIDIVLQRSLPEEPSILDVGTGSGAVGITLALEIPSSTVTATDISHAAASQAVLNAQRLKAVNFSVMTTDLASGLSGPFDLIAANLPYIPEKELPSLQREVREHEPMVALDGGPDGTSLILRLAQSAHRLTSAGSFIILETDRDHEEIVPDFFPRELWREIRTHRDLTGRHRFVSAVRR